MPNYAEKNLLHWELERVKDIKNILCSKNINIKLQNWLNYYLSSGNSDNYNYMALEQ